MIITQTPTRISFFGGGTDYPEYFERESGAVLGTAIDKSSFISATRFYSRLFDYSIRVAYRDVECVDNVDELEHGPFRECLRSCGIERDIELGYFSELPAFSGMGSSSTFTVGLLNALYAFQGKNVAPLELAYRAIDIERNVLKEAVGCQDQVFAAVGGFNLIEFHSTEQIDVHRVPLSNKRLQEFESHVLVFHTGLKRRAADFAQKQIQNVWQNRTRLKRMRQMVDVGYARLTAAGSLEPFGRLLHEFWEQKRGLTGGMSNKTVGQLYDTARSAGAWGGKLLGAGGGGFMLLFVPPERSAAVQHALRHLQEINVKVDAGGSRAIHANPVAAITTSSPAQLRPRVAA